LLVETNNYGAVISHIEPEHLNNIPIPDPSPILKQKIHTLIEESFRLRDESNDIIDEAQELLKESLQLPTIEKLQEKTKQFDKKAKVLNYSVPLNHLGNRFDSSYHVPIIQALEQHLQNNAKEVTAFADKRISKEIILPSHFKRIYVQEGEGTILIGGKNLYSLDPSDKKYLAPSHYNEKLKNNMLLKENMIIISAKGTPGKVVLTPSHWDGWYISSNLIKIVPSSIDIAGYIYCFLSSPYGKTLIERQIYGAVVDIIEPIHIANIKVPLLNDAVTQKIINDKALEANKKRTEAYNLEQQALSILNEQVIYAQKK
jgi:type I restriction enzyme S subunit